MHKDDAAAAAERLRSGPGAAGPTRARGHSRQPMPPKRTNRTRKAAAPNGGRVEGIPAGRDGRAGPAPPLILVAAGGGLVAAAALSPQGPASRQLEAPLAAVPAGSSIGVCPGPARLLEGTPVGTDPQFSPESATAKTSVNASCSAQARGAPRQPAGAAQGQSPRGARQGDSRPLPLRPPGRPCRWQALCPQRDGRRRQRAERRRPGKPPGRRRRRHELHRHRRRPPRLCRSGLPAARQRSLAGRGGHGPGPDLRPEPQQCLQHPGNGEPGPLRRQGPDPGPGQPRPSGGARAAPAPSSWQAWLRARTSSASGSAAPGARWPPSSSRVSCAD